MEDFNISDKTYRIGVLVGNAGTEHPRELLMGIYDCVRETNVEITLFLGSQGHALDFWSLTKETTSTTYNYQYNCLYDYALLGGMDALVIAYGTICIFFSQKEQDEFLSKFKGIPNVVLEYRDDNSDETYIITDNYGGMYDIIEHLALVHGYKKILFLAGPINSMEADLRTKAYYDVMAKYNLPVSDSMIASGDFTPMVEHLVEKLLDDNPDAEALACANDEMASAAYRVCKRRGLVVGRDIAITGYDNVDMSARLDPPLTTANQDGVEMGYESLKSAISICDTGANNSKLIAAHLIVRGSCGCDYLGIRENHQLIESYHRISSVDDIVNIHATAVIAYDLVKRNRNVPHSLREAFIYFYERMLTLLFRIHTSGVSTSDLDIISQSVLTECRKLFNIDFSAYTTHFSLEKSLSEFRMLLDHEIRDVDDYKKAAAYNRIGATFSSYIETLILHNNSENITKLIDNNRSYSYGIQSMIEHSNASKGFYKSVMQQIKERNVKNAFLYMNDKPIEFLKGESTSCPDSMYLAVQMIDGNINVMPSRNVRISRNLGFTSYFPESDSRHQYSALLLFQEKYQYGLLICESSLENMDEISCLALQISTALSYKHLRDMEEVSRKQLFRAMNELEEKNKVLNFISANDQLTNLYNRRGFMEQIFSMLHDNIGHNAYLFFFDLDHLKEINDVYGHSEGDFAIISSANILKDLFGDYGIVARLGGDEFVGVTTYGESTADIGANIVKRLTTITEQFNKESGKPYYIELSAGYTDFVFEEGLDIDEALRKADVVLYEAKRTRRRSVKK